MRHISWVVLFAACANGDVEGEEEETFSQTTQLQHADATTCDPTVYWPAGLYPLVVDRFSAPAPPYEITHIGATLFQAEGAFSGRDCALDAGLHVLIWAADDETLDAPITSTGVIDVTPLAEAYVTADASADDYVLGSVALDPPVRVEVAGDLWIGMDALGDDPNQPGACLGGCEDSGDGIWRADAVDQTWGDGDTSLALFQITVAHD